MLNLDDDCELFTNIMFDPMAIYVDDVKKVVYVTDFTKNFVSVFDYEGTWIGNLGGSNSGSLTSANAIILQPGLFSPLCPILLPETIHEPFTAGSSLSYPIIQKDANNIYIKTSQLNFL